jgi:hypothetical protein
VTETAEPPRKTGFRTDGGFPHLTFRCAGAEHRPQDNPNPNARSFVIPMPRLLPTVSSIALIACSPAMAQVSAADLWAEWQATSAAMGQQMTANATQTADGLVLENFMTRTEAEGTTTTGTLDRITMTEMADGSVSVEMSSPYTATIMFPEDVGGPMITVEVLVAHEGLGITASGSADARTYVYSADVITVSEGHIGNDRGDPPPTIDMEIVARDLATTYLISGPPTQEQRFESSGSVGSVAGRFNVLPPPGEDGRLKASFALGEMTSTASGTIVALATMQQTTDGLPEGFEVDGTTSYDGSRFEMSFEAPGESFSVYYANDGGNFGIALSNEELRYDISASGMETRVSGADIPVEVAVTATSSELSLTVPLAAAPEPSDAALRLSYRDLAASEEVWSLIDPSGAVPRNPLTVVLDATAQVQLMVDLMSAEAMEMDRPPGELRALSVSELEVTFGGTSLTGTADMTFAPGQIVPQPVGRADLSLVGGNALLDQLQGAGVINAEQAGMARGVAGMFTRPGAMPDTIETTIEFQPDGAITANGVPLQ